MTNDERITKLEESLAFAEHNADQIAQELLKAYAAIERLTNRLDSIESRITEITDKDQTPDGEDAPDPALERPPHAAGPKD